MWAFPSGNKLCPKKQLTVIWLMTCWYMCIYIYIYIVCMICCCFEMVLQIQLLETCRHQKSHTMGSLPASLGVLNLDHLIFSAILLQYSLRKKHLFRCFLLWDSLQKVIFHHSLWEETLRESCSWWPYLPRNHSPKIIKSSGRTQKNRCTSPGFTAFLVILEGCGLSSKRLIGEALGMAGIPGVSRATATYHAPIPGWQGDREIYGISTFHFGKNIPNYGPPTVDGFHGYLHKNHLLTKSRHVSP